MFAGMELKDNILVSGNADSTVKIWDILSGQCLQTLSGPNKHQSAVTCLQFNNKFVITSSDDGTVKLWDVKTGGLVYQRVLETGINLFLIAGDFIRDLIALESGGSGGVVWRIRSSPTKLVTIETVSQAWLSLFLFRFVLLGLATERKKPSSLSWILMPR